MRTIGFKNFRKFENFPALDLGPITIFVGENNAGKSTVVKALLSILDFVNTISYKTTIDSLTNLRFYFNKSYFSHVGTFQRAIYNKAPEGAAISFEFVFGRYHCEINIEGDAGDPESISGQVSSIKLTLLDFNIELCFMFKSGINRIRAIFHSTPNPLCQTAFTKEEQRVLKEYFKGFGDDVEMEMPITGTEIFSSYVLEQCLWEFADKFEKTREFYTTANKSLNPSESEKIITGLSAEMINFMNLKKRVFNSKLFSDNMSGTIVLDIPNIEYIYAHAVTQTAVYSAKDINDFFVKTIHEFANQRVAKSTPIHGFIVKWMKEFGIGVDYQLTSVGGEAHVVKIENFDGEFVNLADKGMGSIQLMILLFRLATLMAGDVVLYDAEWSDRLPKPLIIVEEPEQNLHPMLQSKLAELFLSINEEKGYRFIIETHSEYLIRRTQALVGSSYRKNNSFFNPFRVYYFPANEPPYLMPYAKTGRFKEQFGPGFFDEATKWNREILRYENAK